MIINSVEVNGSFAKVGVYIQGYTNLSGLSLSGLTGTVAAGWGYGTYINPTIDNPAGTPADVGGYPGAFNTIGADGSVDLTGVTLVNTTPVNVALGHPLYPFNGVILSAIVNGTPVAESITGTVGQDILIGGGGDDIINGGGGDDTIVWYAGDGHDIVDGGAAIDTDTFVANGTNDAETFFIETVADYQARLGGGAVALDPSTEIVVSRSTDGGVTSEIISELANIDDIDVNGFGGANNFVVSGDFASTDLDPSTITINGGGDADAVDASGITSGHRVVFNGNGGDDTFTSGGGSDVFDGGDGIDTYVVNDLAGTYTVSVASDGIVTIRNTDTGAEDIAQANVEFVVINGQTFDMTQAVQLFDENDFLVGTYDTIQTAHVDAADGYRINLVGTITGQSLTITHDDLRIQGGADDTGNTFTLGAAVTTLTLIGEAPFDVIGNNLANVITGNDAANVIRGAGGNDTLDGGNGSDTYQVSGTGHGYDTFDDNGTDVGDNDTIVALSSNTRIGLAGDFDAANGIEAIDGGAGNTGVYVSGDGNANTLDFTGMTLTNIAFIDGGNGDDTITGTSSADTIRGSGGNDVLDGGNGSDTYQVSGTGHGYDTFDDNGTDVGDNDTIVALSSNTRIGLAGDFDAANGIEAIDGGAGNTGVYVSGDGNANTLDFTGMTLTNIAFIDGGNGDDTITGTSSADTIRGSGGNDVLDGGNGSDTYQVSGTGHGYDTFDDNGTDVGDNDTIVALSSNTRIGLAGDFDAANGIEAIDGGAGNTGVYVSGDGNANTLDFTGMTLSNIAFIDGGNGDDTITGTSSADTIRGSAGNDVLDGGNGSDTYQVSGTGHGYDTFDDNGTDVGDNDTIVALSSNTRIGLAGDFDAANGIEAIDGGAGNTGVYVSGDGNANTLDFTGMTLSNIAFIDGGNGDDTITGTSSDDTIRGSAGNDVLDGGNGSDTYQVSGTGHGYDSFIDSGTSGVRHGGGLVGQYRHRPAGRFRFGQFDRGVLSQRLCQYRHQGRQHRQCARFLGRYL